MKIAIIGAGNVGGTLGKGWASKGHQVVFGVRDTKDPKLQQLVASCGGRASASPVREAASSAAVVVLTVPWSAAEDAVKNMGDLRG